MPTNEQKVTTLNPTVELFTQRSQDLLLLDSMLQETVLKALPDETPAARLKQFATIAVVYTLKVKDIPLSLTTLTEMTGMTRKSA